MTDLGTLEGRQTATPMVSIITVKSLDMSDATMTLATIMPFYTPGAR